MMLGDAQPLSPQRTQLLRLALASLTVQLPGIPLYLPVVFSLTTGTQTGSVG